MNLFADNFPIANSDKDIDALAKQYPQYDRYYIASGSIPDRKELFEALWKSYESYADSHFLKEVKIHFHQRTWEMYLANIFLSHSFTITSSDRCADICIMLPSQHPLWIEAAAPERGIGNDKVPEMVYDIVQDVPEEEMLMRFANSLYFKKALYDDYVAKGWIRDEEPFVIAINTADLQFRLDPGIPLILKCLFALGFMTLSLSHDSRASERLSQPFWSRRTELRKANGSSVPMDFFENPDNAGISAVIYSNQHIVGNKDCSGCDCVLVCNPLAKNPLNGKLFPFFEQWQIADGQLVKIDRVA